MATVNAKFRLSSSKKDCGYIYYRVIHNRVSRQVKTDLTLRASEWDPVKSCILTASADSQRQLYLKNVQYRIFNDTTQFHKIIRHLEATMESYQADDVIRQFKQEKTMPISTGMFTFAKQLIDHLKKLGKERTSETYTSALRSFRQFRQGVDVTFDQVSSEMLEQYEAYLRQKGNTPNTISFYMRILRAIYNRAVEKNLTIDHHPFRQVYTGVAKTVKRAVTIEAIRQIKQIDLSYNPHMELARDAFMLSFYFRGIAFVDLCYLKKTDISNGCLSYRRRKTDQQLFIKIKNPMREIITKYADNASIYLLPFINPELGNERHQYIRAAHRVNYYLHTIGEMLLLPTPLRFYTARHSWASAAKVKKIPISVISEGMGHESEKTTQIYLASLDTSEIDRANDLILSSL